MERIKKTLSSLSRRLSPATTKRERREISLIARIAEGQSPTAALSFKKWKSLALFVLALGFSLTSWSQVAVPEVSADSWAKIFVAGGWDQVESLQKTADGGYIMASSTASYGAGERDTLIIKLDSSGNQEWSKIIGRPNDECDAVIQQTSDNGYILTGKTGTHTFGPIWDYHTYLIKLDSLGDQEWEKTFRYAFDVESIQQTSDGGYILAGDNYEYVSGFDSDIFVVKLDSSGDQDWAKTFGGDEFDWARSIQLTVDGGYIIAASTKSYGVSFAGSFSGDVLVIKLDSSGNQDWAKTYGGIGGDGARDIQRTSDGGYIVSGFWGGGNHGFYVLKLDSLGNMMWDKKFPELWSNVLSSYSIQQTSDGGYIFNGFYKEDADPYWDSLIIKLDSLGDQEWGRFLSGHGSDGAVDGYGRVVSRSIVQADDGGYIVGGYLWLTSGVGGPLMVKLNSSGDLPGCSILDFTPKTLPENISLTTVMSHTIGNNPFTFNEENISSFVISPVSITENNPCASSDTTPPDLTTEAWIPDKPAGTFIDDGDVVNLDDIDEVGEYLTIYSNASDASGIFNHKIRWFRYDSGGTLIGGGSNNWIMDGGSHSLEIPGPLNDGDRIEYQSEATDTIPNPTTYHPAGSDACIATDPNPCAARYSFTVKEVKTWAKAFGGGNHEGVGTVQQTSDGGYIAAGATTVNSGLLVLKLDSSGNQQWVKSFGGSNTEGASCIRQTSDGGYIVTGWTWSYGAGDIDVLILKLDSFGNQQWAKTFGGIDSEEPNTIQQTSDGGYIVTGWTISYGSGSFDFLILKLDSSGNQQWAKTFGKGIARSIQQTSDGGYVVAGVTGSYGAGSGDSLILKLDSSGNQQWAKTFGSAEHEYARAIQQTSDGGYIVAGGTGYDVTADFLILKLDSSGDQQWTKTFGGADDDHINYTHSSIQQTSDGGYVVAGETRSYGAGDRDFLILKLDSSGNQQWARTFGGSSYDYAYVIRRASDGGYIVAGGTGSYGAGGTDCLILKLDQNGNIENCSPPLDVLDADDPLNGSVCDANTLCSEDITAIISTSNLPKDILDPGCTAGSLCNEAISKDILDPGCTANSLCSESIAKDTDNTSTCTPVGSLCMEDFTVTETDACAGCNTPPTVTPYAPTVPTDWCDSSPGLTTLSWTFDDAEDGAGNQTAYQIDLRKGATSCTSVKKFSDETSVKVSNISGCENFVGYGGDTYDWDITVWDSGDASDSATPLTIPSTTSFTITPLHQYPTVCITYVPDPPEQFDVVTFDPACSMTYVGNPLGNPVDGSTYLVWDWDYDVADPGDPSEDQIFNGLATYPPTPPDPTPPQVFYSFTEERNYTVNLKVTDSNNNSCWASSQGAEEIVPIGKSMPAWNETTAP